MSKVVGVAIVVELECGCQVLCPMQPPYEIPTEQTDSLELAERVIDCYLGAVIGASSPMLEHTKGAKH